MVGSLHAFPEVYRVFSQLVSVIMPAISGNK